MRVEEGRGGKRKWERAKESASALEKPSSSGKEKRSASREEKASVSEEKRSRSITCGGVSLPRDLATYSSEEGVRALSVRLAW